MTPVRVQPRTYPGLGHPKWTWVHPKEEDLFRCVAIGAHKAAVWLSGVAEGVVDVGDGSRKMETQKFFAHFVFHLEKSVGDGGSGVQEGRVLDWLGEF